MTTVNWKIGKYSICILILPISFPEPAIPWEGNGGSGLICDRHTKNCMSPVLRMRWK